MFPVSEYPSRKRQLEGAEKPEYVPNKKRYNGNSGSIQQPPQVEKQQQQQLELELELQAEPPNKQPRNKATMMDEDTTTDEDEDDKMSTVSQTRISPPVLDCSLKGHLESGWSNGSFHGWHSC